VGRRENEGDERVLISAGKGTYFSSKISIKKEKEINRKYGHGKRLTLSLSESWRKRLCRNWRIKAGGEKWELTLERESKK